MRAFILPAFLAVLTACGGSSSTGTAPTRYNFAVVDGRNQTTAAGDASLPNRITSQLTRDPQGTFASRALDRVGDFVLPALAYAQGIVLRGEPVAGAIVCGREAAAGEPQVVPLCAFTLEDGKAANTVVPGTKAGTYNILFTAQVESQEPVKDSTTVIVGAGAADTLRLFALTWVFAGGDRVGVASIVRRAADQYGNTVGIVPQVSDAGGFTVSADSISSDATERNAAITLALGNRTATSQMASLYDLRKNQWRLQGACTTEGSDGWMLDITPIDSASFDATSAAVSYASLRATDEAVPVFTWAGTATYYLRDGSVVTKTLEEIFGNSPVAFGRQAFDTVYTSNDVPLVRDAASPTRRYVAPTERGRCSFLLNGAIRKRITLTAQ